MAKRTRVNDALDVLNAGQQAFDSSQAPFLLLVLVAQDAPRDLACSVRDALRAECIGGEVVVMPLDGYADFKGMADACLVLCGDDVSLSEAAAKSFLARRVPVALMADTSLAIPRLSKEEGRGARTICTASPERALERLAHWLVFSCDKHMAIAANFEFCRSEEAFRLTNECAVQCAAVGALGFIAGADLPIICANQSKLALQLASIYGREPSLARAGDLVGVLGAGFGWRALARQLLTFVPGVGWAVKAGVAYAGTFGTARALRAKLDPQDPSRKLLEGASGSIVSLKNRFSKKQEEAKVPIASLHLKPSEEAL